MTSPEHVIAMDPGHRSGWASARMGLDTFVFTGAGVLRQDLLADWFAERQAVEYMGFDSLKEGHRIVPMYNVLVYETWYPREENGSMAWIKGNPLIEAQHIGMVRFVALQSHMKIVSQHPSDKPQALATMPKVLRDLDQDSNEQHDQDARMHLWLYFWRNWFTATVDPELTVTL